MDQAIITVVSNMAIVKVEEHAAVHVPSRPPARHQPTTEPFVDRPFLPSQDLSSESDLERVEIKKNRAAKTESKKKKESSEPSPSGEFVKYSLSRGGSSTETDGTWHERRRTCRQSQCESDI